MPTPKRRAAALRDMPPSTARLVLFNAGAIEAVTLTECLAVDFAALLCAALPETGPEREAPAAGGHSDPATSDRSIDSPILR